MKFIENPHSISGVPVLALLKNQVIPDWLITRLGTGLFPKGRTNQTIIDSYADQLGVLKGFICLMVSVCLACLLLGITNNDPRIFLMIASIAAFLVLVAVACSRLANRWWLDRLHRLEKHVCNLMWFRTSLFSSATLLCDRPKGVFILAGLDEVRFIVAATNLLDHLAFEIVSRQRERPQYPQFGAVFREGFNQAVTVLSQLGLHDGDWTRHFDRAEAEYEKRTAELRAKDQANFGAALETLVGSKPA